MPSISPRLFFHATGIFAIYQLIFRFSSGPQYLGTSLGGSNMTTTVLRQTLEFLDDVSFSVSGVTSAVIVINAAAVMYGLFLARKLYDSVFGSFELYCPTTKTGFVFPRKEITNGLVSKQEVVNDVRRRRKWGDIPPPFPNGWFGLLRSEELKPGCSTSVDAMGQNFAIFRDKGEKIYIVDAYCPHLGANLGVGGQVIGNCIECPFHGWQFDGQTGECSKIPYSNGKIPPQAKVKVWPSLEINGFILVWHDAEGREPFWFPEEIADIKTRGMKYRGCSTHFVNAHIEDIPENGADVSHLTCLHSTGVISGSDVNFKERLSGKLLKHKWTANWEASDTSHIGKMTLSSSHFFLGFKIQSLDFTSQANQIGPGIVHLTLKSPFGRALLLQSLTPQEPFIQKFSLIVYSDWWFPTFLIKMIILSYNVQVERDILVWNNKRYNRNPLLVREDELIRKHRRWYSQFYSGK